MKIITTFILLSVFWGANIQAQGLEIEVPNTWTATESGIAKGTSELSIGSIVEFEGLSLAEYLNKIANLPPSIEGYEIAQVAEIKESDYVVSILRDLTKGENTARSHFFICKDGRNKHRLLELFTENVLHVIAGGKAAIGFCAQQ